MLEEPSAANALQKGESGADAAVLAAAVGRIRRGAARLAAADGPAQPGRRSSLGAPGRRGSLPFEIVPVGSRFGAWDAFFERTLRPGREAAPHPDALVFHSCAWETPAINRSMVHNPGRCGPSASLERCRAGGADQFLRRRPARRQRRRH